MDEHSTVKQLLSRAVGDAVDDIAPPSLAQFAARRRQRRHRWWSVAVAVGVTVAVAVAVAGLSSSATRHPVAHATNSTLPTASASPAGVSVGKLAGYRWSRLPAAPIVGRGGGAAIWTGSQMIVWGGAADNGQLFADGAAYDPARHNWTQLPASPLSPRADPAATMAGNSVFIWGGQTGAQQNGRVNDGALYDPTTRRWAQLPPAPVTTYDWAQAFWTGGHVILLTTPPGQDTTVVHADAFDPDTRQWSTLPDLKLPRDHPALWITAVAAPDRLYVWVHWSRSIHLSATSGEVRSGIDGFTLDTAKSSWASNQLVPDQHHAVDQSLWTGHDLILPASDIYCGLCSHPPSMNRHGYLVNPDTGDIQPLPHGPVDDLTPHYLWTGKALLAYDTGTYTSGPTGADLPGEAAAWDPTTNRWTSLPSAPLASQQTVAVWTGASLIEWGLMYPAQQANRATTTAETAGLQLARR